MTLFSREINHVVIIDMLPQFQLTTRFAEFFDGKTSHIELSPETKEEFFEYMTELGNISSGSGLLLHLISHGNEKRTHFGKDKEFAIAWADMVEPFKRINESSENNFIVNASMTCYSDALVKLKYDYRSIFHAAIFSNTTRSMQAADQNINIYKKCFQGDLAVQAIIQENDAIAGGSVETLRPFGYIG